MKRLNSKQNGIMEPPGTFMISQKSHEKVWKSTTFWNEMKLLSNVNNCLFFCMKFNFESPKFKLYEKFLEGHRKLNFQSQPQSWKSSILDIFFNFQTKTPIFIFYLLFDLPDPDDFY